MAQIKGYDYGSASLATSPVSMQDLSLLKKTLLWSDDDDRYLRMAEAVLADQTDGVDTVPIIHARYLVAFIYPITATIKGFLNKKGHSADDVDAMHNAWFKAVTLTTLLWCQPYFKENEF